MLALMLLASACYADDEVPLMERKAQAINETIMCPVCPGESIDQSQNPLAVQMRAIVMEKIENGWTESQITEFLLERYPRSVLLEPPREGANLLVWLMPPFVLTISVILLYTALRAMRRNNVGRRSNSLDEIHLSNEERNAYIQRIESASKDPGLSKKTHDSNLGESN